MFILLYLFESESCSAIFDFVRPHGLYSPWNSPVQNTGVGGLSLLQGIFPKGSNPGLLCCRRILYQLSHKGSPRIQEWVAYPFFSVFSDLVTKLRSTALQTDSLPSELLFEASRKSGQRMRWLDSITNSIDVNLSKIFTNSLVSKESAYNVGDLGLIPGLGGSPGEGNGNALQYSCLENPMDRGVWQATVHGVARVGQDSCRTGQFSD